ncbi:uncharacterized protein LOC124262817 [Haliotis rubra]|uniref:uncharacterized protein LOC124262817 n=1 Tax=Haliotis rubra TaxID=36100 RepID=UPI001EE5E3FE|nr:uncharacterized protein LOC124262817 [Haliotis rubra]
MRAFSFAAILGCCAAFIFTITSFNELYKGYRFEYHAANGLLVVHNNLACYLVHVDHSLSSAFNNQTVKGMIKDDIVGMISDGTSATKVSSDVISYDYSDYLAAAQCRDLQVYKLRYTYDEDAPSSDGTASVY